MKREQIDYENQRCIYCDGRLEKPKRTRKPSCLKCRVRMAKERLFKKNDKI